MLFSIIVPVYNVEQYLDRCIESLVNQTFEDIEIVLIDDGSADNSGRICDEWAKKDVRIQVIHQENQGLSAARNTGIKKASGEYIVFLDSDDYIALDGLERLAEFAHKKVDVIVVEGQIIGNVDYELSHICVPNGTVLSTTDFFKHSILADKMPMAAWLYVSSREFLLKNNLEFKVGIKHEDEEFTPRLFMMPGSVIVSGVDFYRYYIRENSITKSPDLRTNAIDMYATLISLEQRYKDIDDKQFKNKLLDSLVSKYLSLFFVGRLDKYGKQFVKKEFLKRNAKSFRNKLKVLLYCISPKFYCKINTLIKCR